MQYTATPTGFSALSTSCLIYARLIRGKMKIKHSETEFISFTSELVDIFKPQAEEKGLNLQFEVADPTLDSLTVWIDRNNFDKVLVNLISNAIKYTPAGGEITVSVGHGSDTGMGDYAEFKVTDTGIGLDEKNISRLFDRFLIKVNSTEAIFLSGSASDSTYADCL